MAEYCPGHWYQLTRQSQQLHLNIISKITFSGELHIRRKGDNGNYKGPLFNAAPGQLLISKIRVGQGSFCLVPESLDSLAVSPEYPVYQIDNLRSDSSFVSLILRSPEFLARLTGSASGNTTKQRVRPAYFESLQIPLPSLHEQQALIAKWRAAMDRAQGFERQARKAEREAANTFAEALGLVTPPPLPDRPALIATFRDLDRWSHESVLRRVTGTEPPPPKFPLVRLGDVIADLENGWSPKCIDRPAGDDEWGVLKLGAVSFGVFNERENKTLPASLTPRPALSIEAGQVLVSRANVTRLVGATAYVRATRPRLMLCDKIFRFVFHDESAIDPEFAAEILRTRSVRDQIEANVTGTSPTMKNISKPALLALAFPLPPLERQRTMVKNLTDTRDSVATLRGKAAAVRAKARADFEAAIWV